VDFVFYTRLKEMKVRFNLVFVGEKTCISSRLYLGAMPQYDVILA